MDKISVVINTFNADEHLEATIKSVLGFDEVLICDMHSTDSTLEIAQKYGCRVIFYEGPKCNIVEPARDFAVHAALHRWVFVVDADEVVPAALRGYLYEFIKNPKGVTGLYISRRNQFMHKFMHGTFPDYILRFFERDACTWPSTIHSRPQINGALGYVPTKRGLSFEHLADETITQRLDKINRYTNNEVAKRGHKRYTVFSLLFTPLVPFLRAYILKRGFLDGKAGYINACLAYHYKLMTIVKVIEHNLSKKK